VCTKLSKMTRMLPDLLLFNNLKSSVFVKFNFDAPVKTCCVNNLLMNDTSKLTQQSTNLAMS